MIGPPQTIYDQIRGSKTRAFSYPSSLRFFTSCAVAGTSKVEIPTHLPLGGDRLNEAQAG